VDQCFICHSTANEPENPLIRDVPMHPELSIHLHCFGAKEFKDWTAEQKANDLSFARYWNLMTACLPVTCPECRVEVLQDPKAIGMAAGSWEVCCDTCENVSCGGLSGYEYPEIYKQLEELREKFNLGRNLESIYAEMSSLALQADQFLPERLCECGGHFSLAAFPRCPQCRTVVLRSPFHLVCIPE